MSDKDARFQPEGGQSKKQPEAQKEQALKPFQLKPGGPKAKQFQLKDLKPKHREIIMRLVYHGHSKVQICRDLGYHPRHFQLICNSPLFKQELNKELEARAKSERQARLNKLADPAILAIEQIMTKGRAEFKVTDPDTGEESINTVRVTGRVLVDIIRDILDRTGHKPIERRVEVRADLGNSIIQAHQSAAEDAEAAEAAEDSEESVIDLSPGDYHEVADLVRSNHEEQETSRDSKPTGSDSSEDLDEYTRSLDSDLYGKGQTGEEGFEADVAGATDANRDQLPSSPSSPTPSSAPTSWKGADSTYDVSNHPAPGMYPNDPYTAEDCKKRGMYGNNACTRCKLPIEKCNCPHKNNPDVEYFD